MVPLEKKDANLDIKTWHPPQPWGCPRSESPEPLSVSTRTVSLPDGPWRLTPQLSSSAKEKEIDHLTVCLCMCVWDLIGCVRLAGFDANMRPRHCYGFPNSHLWFWLVKKNCSKFTVSIFPKMIKFSLFFLSKSTD